MIVVLGSVNLDVVATVERHPRPGETVIARSHVTHHGGKGGNQAVAAARLGNHVEFIGCVGSDATGRQLREGLEAEGIGCDRLSVASGHYRSGLHLAPATAVFMAELLLDDRPFIDPTSFRLHR